MKIHLIILFFSLLFLSNSCVIENTKDCHRILTLRNNSDNDIYFSTNVFYYPDSTLLSNPSSDPTNYKIFSNKSKKDIHGDCIEGANPHKKIIVVFFDAIVLENTSWDIVVANDLVLMRKTLSVDSLNSLNWIVTYP
jgi:hypothetical protein